MKTFRHKHFKIEMQPLDAYYECILSCKINPSSSSWQGIEADCETKCLNEHLKSHFMQNNNLCKLINKPSKNLNSNESLIGFDKQN